MNSIIKVLAVFMLLMCFSQLASADKVDDKVAVQLLMKKHLDAVSNKDLKTLAATLPPTGEMQLILPASEITATAKEFLGFHENWFKNPDWTFETKILNTKVGQKLAMAVVEIVYREPLRGGKPYFNRMTVSYVLEKIDGQWYVIKDHASSVEKSTDKQQSE